MTEAQLDIEASDVYDSVKTFLTYCPDGSLESAVDSAMDLVNAKYNPDLKNALNTFQYRKLSDAAMAAYCDITKKPLPIRQHNGRRR